MSEMRMVHGNGQSGQSAVALDGTLGVPEVGIAQVEAMAHLYGLVSVAVGVDDSGRAVIDYVAYVAPTSAATTHTCSG